MEGMGKRHLFIEWKLCSKLSKCYCTSHAVQKNYFDKLTKHECCSWQFFGILTSVYKNNIIVITLAVVNKEKEMITLAVVLSLVTNMLNPFCF